tara:strand:- start:26181 stop:27791 length:1611 start_codon:yes stop_codon:yes gene_type:complete
MNFKKIISDLKKLYNISRSLSFKRKKIRIGLSLILSNLNAFLEIFIVILISFVLTNELPDNEFLEYVDVALFTRTLPLIVLLRLGINFLTHWNREKMFIDLHASLKKDAAKKLFRKENLSFAYILYKVSSESNSIVATYKSLMTAVNIGTQLLTFSVTLLILNPNLTLTVALIALILGKPVSIVLGIFKKNSILNAKIMFFVDSVYERILSNYYLIKLLNKEEEELDRFSKAIDESSDIQWVNSKSSFVVYNLINSSTTLLITILLVQPFFNIKITLETIFILFRAVQFISQITGVYGELLGQEVYLKSYMKGLNSPASNKAGVINLVEKTEENKWALEAIDINYKYEESKDLIFEGLNLKILNGKHTVIQGDNGSGKSTLIGLLAGIYTPDKGQINQYKKVFGYVGPIPLLFEDTLRNNIQYGLEENVKDEIIIQKLMDFKVFKDSAGVLERIISSKTLSSGQMQKISYIRAILNNPDVLFLDEATANLDKDSIFYFNQEINKFKGTIVNITHKPEQFSQVDQKFFIKDKEVHEI